MDEYADVVVVGAGNAAFSAAHAARERVERVCMLEKAPRAWLGGNGAFTAGGFRFTYASLDELRPLLENLDDERAAQVVLPPYSVDDYVSDMRRVTFGRCDPQLTRVLAEESAETIRWLHGKGLRWRLMDERQSYEVDGKRRYFGGLAVGTVDGGRGLIADHVTAARRDGIDIRVESPVVGLLVDGDAVVGVRCRRQGRETQIRAGAVVVAAGGFEADPLMRAQYLGPRWDVAKVRATPYNTGDLLRVLLDLGAQPTGHWSGRHAVCWDPAAPDDGGDLELTNRLARQGFPLGIMVNVDGRRFVDEGADFRNFTYAKYGAVVLEQPGALAFQVFDATTAPLLSTVDYAHPGVSKATSDTLDGLAGQLGINVSGLRHTVEAFNAAVQPGEFNPAVLDGKGTRGIDPPKSNWALPLRTPPFVGYPVTCGISFTFGGVKIDPDGRVQHRDGGPISGLHAAGELVGGLFYHNYPGGSGLMAGSVFGRRAGTAAAEYAMKAGDT